jgi:hypothetical protein
MQNQQAAQESLLPVAQVSLLAVATQRVQPGALSHHGEDGMGRWVGWGIVVHNLAKISKKQAARQDC